MISLRLDRFEPRSSFLLPEDDEDELDLEKTRQNRLDVNSTDFLATGNHTFCLSLGREATSIACWQ